MHFVTLTTDWSKDDFYTGAVKGSILSSCENVEIVTLTNQIRKYSVAEAAFVIRNSYHHFPKGTVHLVAVATDPGPDSTMLAAKIDEHYFLSADNGFLGLLGDMNSIETVRIQPTRGDQFRSFPSLNTFCSATCRIINGEKLSEIGIPSEDYKKQVPLRPTIENDTITGAVIYIDSYGNAITNISGDLFARIGNDRSFTIYVQSKHYKINAINRYYSETTAGDLLAIFNSVNLLEIAIRNGSARDLLNLNTDSTVRVEFK
jgi:S-adenosylmethionine hydrolase